MFENVVVGVNGSEGAGDAVVLAESLLARGGKLTLVHVYPANVLAWRGVGGAHDIDEENRTRALLKGVRERADARTGLRWYPSSSVGRGLHEVAESIYADLLVTGCSRHGRLGRVLAGDDTGAALTGAPCAVAIAPAGYGRLRGELREIGVGYDGAPESTHALAVARSLAADLRTRLSAMEVLMFPQYLFAEPAAPDDASIGDLVDRTLQRMTALQGVEPHAVYGQPADELARYSGTVDLLVVGSRAHGPLGRLVHGSTSRQLAHTARCPLLVLPRTARGAEARDMARDGRVPVGGGAFTGRAA